MEGIIAILATFGTPVVIVWTVMHYRYRNRELALREKQSSDPKKLDAADKEKKLLEQRIQNLESIVCSVDFELNQRLNRLASQASMAARALPAPAAAAAGGAVSGAGATTPLPSVELRPGGTLAAGASPLRAELASY